MCQGLELTETLRDDAVRHLSLDREQPWSCRLNEEMMLVGETSAPHPGTGSRLLDPGEVDVGRDILPPR